MKRGRWREEIDGESYMERGDRWRELREDVERELEKKTLKIW